MIPTTDYGKKIALRAKNKSQPPLSDVVRTHKSATQSDEIYEIPCLLFLGNSFLLPLFLLVFSVLPMNLLCLILFLSFSLLAWALVIFLIAFFLHQKNAEPRAMPCDAMRWLEPQIKWNKTKSGDEAGRLVGRGVSAWHTTNKFVNKCGQRWPTRVFCPGMCMCGCGGRNIRARARARSPPEERAGVMMTVAH